MVKVLQQRSSVFIHCSNLGYVVSSPHQKSEFGVRGSQTLLESSETVSMSSGKCIRPPVCSGVFNPRIFENPRQQSRKMKNSTSELFRTSKKFRIRWMSSENGWKPDGNKIRQMMYRGGQTTVCPPPFWRSLLENFKWDPT